MTKSFRFLGLLFLLTLPLLHTQEKSFPPRAILIAAYKGDLALVNEILGTNPPRDVRDEYGATALHDAMFQKDVEIIRLLIEYGYDVNDIGPHNGYTPLHYAVLSDNVAAARFLLSRGADRNIKGKDGLTPLAKARKESRRELVLLLSGK